MDNKRYKPLIGKMFFAIWVPTSLMMIAATALASVELIPFLLLLATDVFTFYFLASSLAGYVELREKTVFIRFGFIKTVEIPYSSIRDITKERKFYADSMMSIKNSLEHINIKYAKFDIVSVSVVGNDELIEALRERIARGRA